MLSVQLLIFQFHALSTQVLVLPFVLSASKLLVFQFVLVIQLDNFSHFMQSNLLILNLHAVSLRVSSQGIQLMTRCHHHSHPRSLVSHAAAAQFLESQR